MEALPYYKWFWQKWRASREVQRMGYVARGLYRELLDEQWDKGGIPDDVNRLAAICDCPLEVMQIEWPKVACFFTLKRGKMRVNGTLESMRTESDSKRVQLAGVGRIGAMAKLNKINPNLANAKQKPSKSHIEEKRREEKNTPLTPLEGGMGAKKPNSAQRIAKLDKKPMKTKTVSDLRDERYVIFKEIIRAYWDHKNPGLKMIWGGEEGKTLNIWLKNCPDISAEQFRELMRNRAKSEVNHGDRPAYWIPIATSFAAGPIDRFKLPQGVANGKSGENQKSPARERVNGARRVLAKIAVERGLVDVAGDGGETGTPLPFAGPGIEH